MGTRYLLFTWCHPLLEALWLVTSGERLNAPAPDAALVQRLSEVRGNQLQRLSKAQ